MVCYNVEHKEFRILCEYMCQRGQQGMKRCERVSGLDFGLSCFLAFLRQNGVWVELRMPLIRMESSASSGPPKRSERIITALFRLPCVN